MANDNTSRGKAVEKVYQLIADEYPYGLFTEQMISERLGFNTGLSQHDLDYAFQRLQFEKKILPVGSNGEFIFNKEHLS